MNALHQPASPWLGLPPSELHMAACSQMGVQQTLNQDAYWMAPQYGLCALSDGMGAGMRGEMASHLLVHALRHACSQYWTVHGPLQTLTDWDTLIQRVLADTHRYLQEDITRADLDENLGCTLAVWAHVLQDKFAVWWVGDSRVYWKRGEAIRLVTSDHSRAQDLLRKGLLTPEAAGRHPARHCLTQAVGMGSAVVPDRFVGRFEPGDRFLLCTDGVHDALAPSALLQTLSDKRAQRAVDACVQQARLSGSTDDATALIVEMKS